VCRGELVGTPTASLWERWGGLVVYPSHTPLICLGCSLLVPHSRLSSLPLLSPMQQQPEGGGCLIPCRALSLALVIYCISSLRAACYGMSDVEGTPACVNIPHPPPRLCTILHQQLYTRGRAGGEGSDMEFKRFHFPPYAYLCVAIASSVGINCNAIA